MHLGGAAADHHFWFDLAHQGLFLFGLTLLVGWVLNVALAGNREAFDRILPIVSMTAICIILTIIAAASRDDLLAIGLLLLLALMGAPLGVWIAMSIRPRRKGQYHV